MYIHKEQLEEIIKTLPIGYYAFGRIPLVCSEDSDNTYYDSRNDSITISVKCIAEALKDVDETKVDKESVCRAMVYHEVSHAMITPKPLPANNKFEHDIMNIFEDERIERFFDGYYLNVNFFENVCLMNASTYDREPDPANPRSYFYAVVRFHKGHPYFIQKSKRLITKWKEYNFVADENPKKIHQYYLDVMAFFKEMCEMLKTGEMPSMEGSESAEGTDAKSEGSVQQTMRNTIDARRKDAINSAIDSSTWTISHVADIAENPTLTLEVDHIVENCNKRNNSGAGASAYSGVFNPRNCLRTDYRFFDKKAEMGINRYGSVHLNLFLDVSGSMRSSCPEVNRFLKSIYAVEKRHANFSVDLVICGEGETLLDFRTHPYIVAHGGNAITTDVFDIYKKLQKPNTANYNIALFDGDAFTDTYSNPTSVPQNFSVFNHSNCAIITDSDNQRYFKYVPNAIKICTDDYASDLKKNVVKVLASLFR